jgi:hypothetical protein
MNVKAFENLELIPEVLQAVQDLKILVDILKPELTTKRGVAMFLGVTERTINNYISDGRLIDGYHFNRKNDKILVFIEDTVIEFKTNKGKGR